MASSHATTLMPVLGHWKGTGSPVLSLVGRAGQLLDFNLFDSATNYNAVVAASSGSGKAICEELPTTRDLPPVTRATRPEADALAGGGAASG